MIAAGDVGKNRGAFKSRAQRLRDKEIIQSPTDVSRAGRAHRTPPRVMLRTFLEFAEGVHEAGGHERIEAGAFFRRETVVLHVGLRIREINLRVRHVQIATPDDGLFLFELLEKFQEVLVPLLAIRQAGEFALALTYFKSPLVLSK